MKRLIKILFITVTLAFIVIGYEDFKEVSNSKSNGEEIWPTSNSLMFLSSNVVSPFGEEIWPSPTYQVLLFNDLSALDGEEIWPKSVNGIV
ncbi:hypothetical protein [Heyndrickxia oleronia]|uniref:Uncharacterized protein n=1 Tax=Heyndrickxia oleronia TaxID=38875 RepID=A0AAW6T2C0_9BACI|nr:hypothetical protein [Heyndrickxia oleronia]MDH5164465.1 hypothetical protein [Heyndrickxia oleronia]